MYNFGYINDIPVVEYRFKKRTSHLGMAFSDNNDNPFERLSIFIPGFHVDENGFCITRKDFFSGKYSAKYLPEKRGIKRLIEQMINGMGNASKDKMVIFCTNDETEEIGMALVDKKKWVPVLSTIEG